MTATPAGEPTPKKIDASVTYSVRDLLSDIRDSLTRMDAKLDMKADKTELRDIDKRVQALEFFRLGVEVDEKNQSEKTAARRWAVPVLVTAIGVTTTVLGVVLH